MLENMARETGLEPATSVVTGRRSLSHFIKRFDSGQEMTGSKARRFDSVHDGVESRGQRGLRCVTQQK